MSPVSAKSRQMVVKRAKSYCEYCQTFGLIVISMTVDHIIPTSAGGTDDLDNLSFACERCNNAKSDHQTGIDPETENIEVLYNPRHHTWGEHFQWNEDGTHVVGLTSIGRATINRLKMNVVERVSARKLWVAAGWHPPKVEDNP